MLRARLAYAYQCSPVDLRDLTWGETRAMCAVLEDVAEAQRRAARR
ncbi:hypothetical protein [Phytomonospora endophytica]|uniref:Uncharacterized protein n=1 Tax=Phytomonospora endophytica TaxID=714109 RepID=A0A841FQH0_9ACTN|nr:hypothetical protein [Phytomonospora endophytica]MBB6038326.1 hypothetical protein [Phytomonospora endophytica]